VQQDEFKPRKLETFTGRMPVAENSIVSTIFLAVLDLYRHPYHLKLYTLADLDKQLELLT